MPATTRARIRSPAAPVEHEAVRLAEPELGARGRRAERGRPAPDRRVQPLQADPDTRRDRCPLHRRGSGPRGGRRCRSCTSARRRRTRTASSRRDAGPPTAGEAVESSTCTRTRIRSPAAASNAVAVGAAARDAVVVRRGGERDRRAVARRVQRPEADRVLAGAVTAHVHRVRAGGVEQARGVGVQPGAAGDPGRAHDLDRRVGSRRTASRPARAGAFPAARRRGSTASRPRRRCEASGCRRCSSSGSRPG